MKTVVLISSGQPSVNPRLVKEANSLVEAGYKVYVIYSFWTNWAWATDKILFEQVSWTPILVGGSPYERKILYYCTRVRFKMMNFIAKKITLKFGIAELAKGRASKELFSKAKSINASIYIAHNLAALPVAVKAAKHNNAKCGFDIEDFHRNEASDMITDFSYRISKFLEDKYLRECDYLTAASPLIADEYNKIYSLQNLTVINNVFAASIQETPISKNNIPLKLFWFSQTVGIERGIEDVILALNLLDNEHIELHLLGQTTQNTENYFRNMVTFKAQNLNFHPPIEPDQIFEFSTQFNIGLALELNRPYNRVICLTNKIFSYMVSGLAVIASETKAQKAFLEENIGIGYTYPNGDINKLAEKIDSFYLNRALLDSCMSNSFHLGRTKYNWENESKSFLQIISQIIK